MRREDQNKSGATTKKSESRGGRRILSRLSSRFTYGRMIFPCPFGLFFAPLEMGFMVIRDKATPAFFSGHLRSSEFFSSYILTNSVLCDIVTKHKRQDRIMNKLIEEAFAVMEAAGHKTFRKNAAKHRKAFCGKPVPDTFAHHAPILQDIGKRQKTDIDTLNCCVPRIGRGYGIRTSAQPDFSAARPDMIAESIRGFEDVRRQNRRRSGGTPER